MFKPVTASILLLAFVAQTFSAPFIRLDYFINTAAYAKNCVNKTKPKMHCNGQCQVMKKMQEQERKDQQNSEQKAFSKILVISSKSFFCVLNIPSRTSDNFFYSINTGHPTDRARCIFHPPQA